MVSLGPETNGTEVLEAVRQVSVVGRVHGRVGGVGGVPPVGGAEELVEFDGAAADSAQSGNKGMVSRAQRLTTGNIFTRRLTEHYSHRR